jgi:hypothetical protein
MNGAHLITKKDVWKKTLFIVVLNNKNDSWNIIYLHQVLKIETLQIMEPKREKNLTIQFIMLHLWFCKIKNYNFKHCPHTSDYYLFQSLVKLIFVNQFMWYRRMVLKRCMPCISNSIIFYHFVITSSKFAKRVKNIAH